MGESEFVEQVRSIPEFHVSIVSSGIVEVFENKDTKTRIRINLHDKTVDPVGGNCAESLACLFMGVYGFTLHVK